MMDMLSLTFPRNFPRSYFLWGRPGSTMISGISLGAGAAEDPEAGSRAREVMAEEEARSAARR